MPIGDPGQTGQTFIPSPGGGPPTPGTPAPPSSGPGGTSTTATSSALSSRAVKVVGFVVAGAALVALADVAPEAGVGLTAILGLGVLLAHATELQQLVNGFSAAIGQPQTA